MSPRLSKRAWAGVLASSVLPVVAIVVFVGASGADALLTLFYGCAALVMLLVASAVELAVGLAMRRRVLCLDGALRGVLVLLVASPLGVVAVSLVPIAWSFVQSFNPAYACRSPTCGDAVVDERKIGGEMLTPQCYIELVRLADPRGGRAAAVAVLRRSWPSFSKADTDQYAREAGLLSLGRGFWRADRCEDWSDPRSMRDRPPFAVAWRLPSPARGEGGSRPALPSGPHRARSASQAERSRVSAAPVPCPMPG